MEIIGNPCGPDEHVMVPDTPHTLGEFTAHGYVCTSCGFQTMTVGYFVPTEKECPSCGSTFMGMPDHPAELCEDCFIEQIKSLQSRAD